MALGVYHSHPESEMSAKRLIPRPGDTIRKGEELFVITKCTFGVDGQIEYKIRKVSDRSEIALTLDMLKKNAQVSNELKLRLPC